MEFNCFVLYRIFYRLYQQEDDRQVVSREIFPGWDAGRNCFNIISDSTVQLLGEKVGNVDYFFPARRAVVRTHKYICVFIYF